MLDRREGGRAGKLGRVVAAGARQSVWQVPDRPRDRARGNGGRVPCRR